MKRSPRSFAPPRLTGAALISVLALAGCGKVLPVVPVMLPPLSAVRLAVHADTLQTGQIKQFTATALDTLGAVVGGATFDWSSGDLKIFSVGAGGVVHAVSEGTAKLYAKAGGRSDSATISVYVQRGWFTQISNTSNDLNGVFMQSDRRTGWAVGAGGRIVATTDAGNTWGSQISNTFFNLNAVWFTNRDSGWVVGSGGTVLHTVNGGMTWSAVTSNASENLLDVCFATADTGWVVGSNGVVLRTFDRGKTWQRQTPTQVDLQSVSFGDTRNGWAVGNGGVILGTHDRGLSWYTVQPALTSFPLLAVWRRDSLFAWAAGQSGVVLRTVTNTDTGWVASNAGAAITLQGLCYPSATLGYAAGYNTGGSGVVLRTDDGGMTWQTQFPGTQFRLKDIYFTDPLDGWAVGRGGVIVHTSTGGLP